MSVQITSNKILLDLDQIYLSNDSLMSGHSPKMLIWKALCSEENTLTLAIRKGQTGWV